jgi:hypothetical protein
MRSLQLLSIKQDHLPFAEVDTSVFFQEVFRQMMNLNFEGYSASRRRGTELRGRSPCRTSGWSPVPCPKPHIGLSSAPRVGWAHNLLGYGHSASPGNPADRSFKMSSHSYSPYDCLLVKTCNCKTRLASENAHDLSKPVRYTMI